MNKQMGRIDRLNDGLALRANARLIAAAPELLEALERVLKVDLIERPIDAFESFKLAEKAIAKAKGQQ